MCSNFTFGTHGLNFPVLADVVMIAGRRKTTHPMKTVNIGSGDVEVYTSGRAVNDNPNDGSFGIDG